jgi:hypothetical protein
LGPNLAKNIPEYEGVNVHDYMLGRNLNTMFLAQVTESEICNIINNFESKTSTDNTDLSMSIIKKVANCITFPFTHICNKSFSNGIFPDKMKVAKVIPLFKSGEKNIFTNYRPVSLLSQFSKVLEKLYNNRLDNFLEANNLLSESQYGFRTARSTAMALIELLEEITSYNEQKKFTIGVFIDLKKSI